MRVGRARFREAAVQLLLVPVAFFLGAKLSLAFAVPPNTLVLLWIPNAFLLATHLHFGFRRWPAFAAAVLAAELAADYGSFRPVASLLFGAINLGEVAIAYWLLRRWRFDAGLPSPADLAKFVVAAPLLASFVASVCAAAVYRTVEGATNSFVEILRVWWFGDGLGLLILTPLLFTFWPPPGASPELRRRRPSVYDLLAGVGAIALAAAFALARRRELDGLTLRAYLLLLPAIWVAVRFDLRATSLTVLALALLALNSVLQGREPFGALPLAETVISTQELLAVLSALALGLAALLSQLRRATSDLERQVTERTADLQRANQRLESLAVRDPLTGVLNRRGLDSLLTGELERERRHRRGLALILLDIDRFKGINDAWGHDVGDEVLRRVVTIVQEQIRASDIFARTGGEEFLVVAPELDEAGALALAERIRIALRSTRIPVGDSSLIVTASFGVATPLAGDLNAEVVLKRADRALYRAKVTGRDRVVGESELHAEPEPTGSPAPAGA